MTILKFMEYLKIQIQKIILWFLNMRKAKIIRYDLKNVMKNM
jgi:hypothetical protein